MATLEEVKNFASEFLRKELEMLQLIASLNMDQIKEFNDWYKTSPHYKGLGELLRIVRQPPN